MKQRLAIIGAGEMALQAKHYAEIDGRYEVIGFIVDYPESLSNVSGLPVLGKIRETEVLFSKNLFDCIFIGIGYNHLIFKKNLYKHLSQTIPFATIIAAPTYINPSAIIGHDVIIYPGCIIDKNVVIEDNVVLNLGATISHDCIIGNSSFIGVRCAISGFCQIGECVFMGTNSTTIDNIHLCNDVQLGAATVVTKNITKKGLYIGAPARKIK